MTSDEASGAARIVQGTFEAPKYLTGDGGPGTVLANDDDPDGIPTADGTMTVDFFCTVPAAATAEEPAGTIIYGHGLLGTRQPDARHRPGGNVGGDLVLRARLPRHVGRGRRPDRRVLQRPQRVPHGPGPPPAGPPDLPAARAAARSPDGFASDPAFQDADGRPTIDTDQVALLGASQGGILGGVASSLTDD
ncbi:MAG: hypothetical protein R2702_03245 [Acidimicrobiales bacterium]